MVAAAASGRYAGGWVDGFESEECGWELNAELKSLEVERGKEGEEERERDNVGQLAGQLMLCCWGTEGWVDGVDALDCNLARASFLTVALSLFLSHTCTHDDRELQSRPTRALTESGLN